MIEVTMFVKDQAFNGGGNLLGVATLIYDKGKFGVGLSIRNPKDKFNKAVGKEIAYNRAVENLNTNSFSQIVEIESKFEDALLDLIPGMYYDRGFYFFRRFREIGDEMNFKMAKELMARDN